jgi:hypothetical protein
MKICPNCNFENFHETNSCERCKNSLSNISKESFIIDRFVASNSDTYVVISVLIALAVFLYDPSFLKDVNISVISSQFSMIIVIPLSFSIYLLLKLIVKGWKYSDFTEKKVTRDLIQIYLYTFISLLVIFGLLLIIIKTNNTAGFCLLAGIVTAVELLAGSENKKIVAEMFLLSALFTISLGIFIFLWLKTIYKLIPLDWLYVYLFWYSIFLFFIGIGLLIGSGIYYLLETSVRSYDEKTRETTRNFFTIILDSRTNELFILWIVLILGIGVAITLYIFNIFSI